MTRLIVIGSSHVAALKRGWEAIKHSHPDVELDFFAAPAPHFNFLTLGEDLRFGLGARAARRQPDLEALVTEINGRASVDLSAADYVLRAGLGRIPLHSVAGLMVSHDIDGLRSAGAPRQLSRAAFDAICAGLAEAALPDPEWRGWPAPRLVILAFPTPAESCVASQDNARYGAWRTIALKPGRSAEVIDAYLRRLEATLATHRILLHRQPAETLLPSGLTAERFTRDSRRLRSDVRHPDADHVHMNGEYGALVLDSLLARLGSGQGGGAREHSEMQTA